MSHKTHCISISCRDENGNTFNICKALKDEKEVGEIIAKAVADGYCFFEVYVPKQDGRVSP